MAHQLGVGGVKGALGGVRRERSGDDGDFIDLVELVNGVAHVIDRCDPVHPATGAPVVKETVDRMGQVLVTIAEIAEFGPELLPAVYWHWRACSCLDVVPASRSGR